MQYSVLKDEETKSKFAGIADLLAGGGWTEKRAKIQNDPEEIWVFHGTNDNSYHPWRLTHMDFR